MRIRTVLPLLAFLAAGASTVRAQAWDSPNFLAPRPGEDLGGYFIEPSHGDWGLMGIWRQAGTLNLGVRAGLLDAGNDTRFAAGTELYGALMREGPDTPVDASWLVGLGATFDGGTFLRIPAGVSVGRVYATGGVGLQPYVSPRLTYDVHSSGGHSSSEFNVVADFGIDLLLGRMRVRAAAGVGHAADAFGIGVAWRTQRTVAVR